MAGSSSLPSLLAVFAQLGGLRTATGHSRNLSFTPSPCRCRIVRGVQCRGGHGVVVVRSLQDPPNPKSRRRATKSVVEVPEADSETAPKRTTRRKKKIVELKDEHTETVSAGEESSSDSSTSKPRRQRRSSVKIEVSESDAVVEVQLAEEANDSDAESPEDEKEKLSTSAVSRSRRKKKATDATTIEDSRNLKSSTTESSLPIGEDEHIQRLGVTEEEQPSVSRVEPGRSNKSVRRRKTRGKAVDNEKVSGDEELQIRVQETAVSSLNGSTRGETANEGQEAESKADIQTSEVAVKKKRQRKARKKPVAVVDLDEDKVAEAMSSENLSEEDEASSSNHEDSVLRVPESEESPPPKTKTRRRRRRADAIKQADSEDEGSDESGAAPILSTGDNILWNGTQIEEATDTTRVRFPAPTWGPQWWNEIQSKSQATISFQDIAERRDGFQARSKVSLEAVPEDAKTIDIQRPVEVIESVEQRIELTESINDSATLNGGDTVIRRREGLKKSGRRIAKLPPVQAKLTHESYDDWLKKKMLALGKPTEEPWLLESMIAVEAEQELRGDLRAAASKQEVTEVVATIEEPPRRAVDPPMKEPEVEVEILINTSECTMQRMAILENKKLVEFSIEPVNTKVQVGNIYLGRVKQLLPGMSGVFVDIGGSRLALLDIARNQYPYTFPPVYASENSSSSNAESEASLEDKDLAEEDADFTEEEDDDDDDDEAAEAVDVQEAADEAEEIVDVHEEKEELKTLPKAWRPHKQGGPITVNFGRKFSKWRNVEVGMPIIVQVKKEAMGKKGPRLTAFPTLAGRFWVLIPRGNTVGVSARITGPERRRLKLLAQALRPQDLGITVRTEAVGHEQEELERDLTRLIDTWKEIMEKAAFAALAVERGEEAAVPVLLHREMGQTLTIIRDLFTEKISRLVVDSSQSYQEVINYLQEVAPHLMSRVVLYSGKVPIFDKFNVELDLDRFSSERVKLPNGGYLVMQETEALVSVDVNGGTGMLGLTTRQREAILEVNLAAAKQIASEIRLRDIGGIIVVDFIDMDYAEDERLVYEEMRKAIQRDRSKVSISEISEFGLMEMTRKRVRSSVTLTIHSPCSTCKGTGRVEALETTLSKIERAIRRLLAEHPNVEERSSDASKWPQVLLRVEPSMLEFLKSWKKKRIVQLGHSLKVWITLKPGMELARGHFEVTHRSTSSSSFNNNRSNKSTSSHGSSHMHGSSSSLVPGKSSSSVQQQEKAAVTSPNVLGKRIWPKRKRHFS